MRLLNITDGPNCFTLDAARPSKLQKQLGSLKNSLKKTPIFANNRLTGITIKNISSASPVTSIILRQLLENNRESLRHLDLIYSTDIMREETRIIFEEFGIDEFPNLEYIGVQMNRAYLLNSHISP